MKQIILILFITSFQRASASDTIFLKFIHESDTLNVFLDDIIHIDTINSNIEITPKMASKLHLESYSNAQILLNTGNNYWIEIYVSDILSSEKKGPNQILLVNGSLFMNKSNKMVISGQIWKAVSIRYNK